MSSFCLRNISLSLLVPSSILGIAQGQTNKVFTLQDVGGAVAKNPLVGAEEMHKIAMDQLREKLPGAFQLNLMLAGFNQNGHFEGAVNIPLPTLRNKMNELPLGKEILIYCGVGQRSYYATRILRLNGFDARNISGGMTTSQSQKQVHQT